MPTSLRPSLEAMGIYGRNVETGCQRLILVKSWSANDEAKAWKTIWSAGQGVTKIDDSPSVE